MECPRFTRGAQAGEAFFQLSYSSASFVRSVLFIISIGIVANGAIYATFGG